VDGDGDEDADDGADRPHESVPLDPVAVDDQRQDVPAEHEGGSDAARPADRA
jgi:hypothetical protein